MSGAFSNETLGLRYCYPSGKLGKVLIGWRVAEHLQSVKGTEVSATMRVMYTSMVRSDCQLKSLRFLGREGCNLLRDQIAARSENRRAYAYHCCAFGNGDIHIF